MAASSLASAPATGAFTQEVFAQAFAGQSGAPGWWLERKRAAYERFAALSLPARTDEGWRFSNIGGVKLEGFHLPPSEDLAHRSVVGIEALKAMPLAGSLRFLNHRLTHPTILAPDLAAKGVIVTTIAEALRTHGDVLKAHFMAQPQKLGSEKFASLHAAFVENGAFIYVPKGVELAHPILVVHAAAGAGSAVFPHTLVVAEELSKVIVIDAFSSADSAPALAIGANDLYAGHGAQLSYVGIQDWSRDTLSFQFNSTVVRRDARVQSLNVHLGARQARHESMSQMQAPGAFSEMLALTVAAGSQEFDQRTLQLHQAPNTKSDLLYKNALLESAKTIFSGLIIVDPDAQKTDAYQSNRNLVLSDNAEANSLPGLEIHANDVRCTHGATTSRIDAEQAFYLESRGLTPAAARDLLVFGFFEEVLNRLASDEVHAVLRGLLQSKLKL